MEADDIQNGKHNAIRRLPQSVVELICAGEVIHRPVSAVKELLDNSIDSGATNISVVLKSGGLRLIQVKDDGCGIPFESLDILCERYTTSKLTAFEDLKTIKTLGFRGEALASISCISHLSVITKKPNDKIGYKACYKNGKLVEKPKPIAANAGTQITVEDLFYNVPVRTAAIKSTGGEGSRICDLVTKYAVNFPEIAFMVKRHIGNSLDLRTEGNCSTLDCVRRLYGTDLARELKEFQCEDLKYGFEAQGLLSNPISASKKFEFILFINDRLVECYPIRKIIEMTYEKFVPKRIHPFVYLKLHVVPSQIDVNVHPAKQEVSFLYQDEVVACIQKKVEETIITFGNSRTFLTTFVPMERNTGAPSSTQRIPRDHPLQSATSKTQYPYQKIRTDEKERKLSEFFDRPQLPQSLISLNFPQSQKVLAPLQTNNEERSATTSEQSDDTGDVDSQESKLTNLSASEKVDPNKLVHYYRKSQAKSDWRKIQLSSVLELQQEICGRVSLHLRSLFRKMKFVGCVDPMYTLLQYKTGLYMVNIEKISEELFYQMFIFCFGNFDVYLLSEPCSIAELIALGLKMRDPLTDLTATSRRVVDMSNFLMEKSEMLWDYFSLQLKDGKVAALPKLLKDYVVQLEGLPEFMLQLTSDVDWTSEKACFESFCRVASKFFAFKKRFCAADSVSNDPTSHWSWAVEHAICKAAKHRLLPPSSWARQQVVVKLTDLETLYKVFERC